MANGSAIRSDSARRGRLRLDIERATKAVAGSAMAAVMLATVANAASATNSFSVKLVASAACTISATPMTFRNVTTVTGTETAQAIATVRCNRNIAYALSLGILSAPSVSNAIATATLSLRNGANTITAMLSLNSGAQLATGGNDRSRIVGQLVAQPAPAAGVYQATQTIYVIY